MTEVRRRGLHRPDSQKLLLLAALTVLGLALNAVPLELFFGVQFLLGSIPAVLALLLWRDWSGVAVGAVASLATWKLWGHPWAVVIFTAELVALTLALRRTVDRPRAYPGQVVLWDIGYWTLLGAPLVFLFYGGLLQIDPANVGVVAIKQGLNGCLNTAAAFCIYLLMQLLGPQAPEPSAELLAAGMAASLNGRGSLEANAFPSSPAPGRQRLLFSGEVTLRSVVFALVLTSIAAPTLLLTLLTSHQLELATQRGQLNTLKQAAVAVARTPIAELRSQARLGDGRYGQIGFYRRDRSGEEVVSDPALFGNFAQQFTDGGSNYVHQPELQLWIPRRPLPMLKKWVNGYWHVRQGFSLDGNPMPILGAPIEVEVWQPAKAVVVSLQQDSSAILMVFTGVFVLGAFLSDWVGRAFDREFNKVLAPLQSPYPSCSLSVHDEPMIPTLSLSRVGELRRMASQINQRIQRVNLLTSQLAMLSVTDQLTGCLNRRALDQELRTALERSRRNGMPLSLIAFDIDHFKSVNDRFGHPVGDQVLTRVAGCVQERLRSTDAIYRIGGEEFLLLLFDCPERNARRLAEQLRAAIAALDFEGDAGEPFQVTISAGVTQFDPLADAPESLVQRADQGLYAAKQAGRNCVQPV